VAAAAISAAPSPASSSATVPSSGDWSTAPIKAIDATCAKPWAILGDSPRKKDGGDGHAAGSWPFARQALLANPDFVLVGRGDATCQGALCFPKAPGQVHFTEYPYLKTESVMLIGTCADGGTCNRLAAMYKATVKTARPTLGCGTTVPAIGGEGNPVGLRAGGPAENSLPKSDDSVGECARLAACMIALDHSTPGDPGIECMKAPSKFKISCARKYPCSEVVACMKQ
jgi:hypothetical protein